MLNLSLLVGLGGAIGSVLRFIISKVFISSSPVFSYVALVNITGCLIAGIMAGYMDRHLHSEALRLFLITGVMGGFTTFSAFSLDILNLVRNHSTAQAAIYLAISVVGALLAVFIGYILVNR